MYEAVCAHPDGDSTVARLAATAASAGYDGIVVRNWGATSADPDAVGADTGADVVRGTTVSVTDRAGASERIRRRRENAVVVAARASSPSLNRFVAESERVDVLAAPMADGGDVNHVIVKAARTHGVRLEFDFAGVLRASGGDRVQALRGLRKLRELVEHYDAPFVVSGRPASHLHVRSPRELVAVGAEIGFTDAQVRAGLREWTHLAARNRRRLSAEFIAPGVKRGRYEEDP
ncbi:RNase P subunit p30 family protein [Halobacterium salinarum]|uniref:Ribonuclease P protein component 3 n=1 Tax=Halobacterium salinarum (strain ATCC 33171 / DSM 3754 / JCM 8978 / NBRC 102687 / NCIMB 764 / 91-R6) TaxID=2597657 RepID=A0A4D6GX33_HALS9|nr:RNase P subunit p30 family protein [Halobacterium salinarum]MDL0131214.1 RNase P subunit p30 family protein [Halobacterium salinarum]MDL0144865.1 RNase P subunit p30 family protein [Halobacterium salinarum]QCC45082.1 ribonuclease P protein component 3 [Halobacterium salinarum]TYO76194.1 ribonuclease P protein subunit Rpp30 [Halobacterium salinarum DSM 3754]